VPRPFVLVRHRDPSGVSGTGVVAEGVAWSDGSASLRWRAPFPSVVFWPDGVPMIVSVHGHDGATRVQYLDQVADWSGSGDCPGIVQGTAGGAGGAVRAGRVGPGIPNPDGPCSPG
jgi:hypothetical protein